MPLFIINCNKIKTEPKEEKLVRSANIMVDISNIKNLILKMKHKLNGKLLIFFK